MVYLLLLYFFITSAAKVFKTEDIFLQMPPVKPRYNQTYLCTAFKMPNNEYLYIVDFVQSKSTGMEKDAIHHVLLYGCKVPGYMEKDSPDSVWNCGDRDDTEILVKADVCQEGTQIVSRFKDIEGIPPETALKAGFGTDLNYLVLQLHFGNVNAIHKTENYETGMVLKTLPSSTSVLVKVVGTYFLGTEGELPPNSIVRMETSCLIDEDVTIHPISFSTHTHGLGLQVAAYLKKSNGTWYRIGISPPVTTQHHGLVNKTAPVIQTGDIIAARCLMYNSRNHTVYVGFDTIQEMCNFYLNYYTDEGSTMREKYCYTDGPPKYYWRMEDYMRDLPAWIEDDLHLVDEELKQRKMYDEKENMYIK